MFHTFQLPEKMPTAFVVNCDMSAQALITDLQNRGLPRAGGHFRRGLR